MTWNLPVSKNTGKSGKSEIVLTIQAIKILFLALLFVPTVIGINASYKSFPRTKNTGGETDTVDGEVPLQYENLFMAVAIVSLISGIISVGLPNLVENSACANCTLTNIVYFLLFGVSLLISGGGMFMSTISLGDKVTSLVLKESDKLIAGALTMAVSSLYIGTAFLIWLTGKQITID